MKRVFSVLSLVTLAAVFSACETNTTSNMNANTSAAQMTDSQLETAVKTRLDADAQLKAADIDVDADADDNTVTLSGTVMSQDMRMKAVNAAKGAHTGVIVNDKIEVRPGDIARESYTEDMARDARTRAGEYGDRIGNTLDDAWIHTKITAKLFGNTDTPGRKINVDVNNNVVTLRGAVDTAAEKAEAERVAKETDGVRQVINQLRVGNA